MSGIREMAVTARRLSREVGPVRAAALVGRKWLRKLTHRRPPNTIAGNQEVWSTHDWSRLGEEWTASEEWKRAVVECLLDPNVPAGGRVLEIGPGAGRWTEVLLGRASHVTAVDLSPVCIRICKERFGERPNAEFVVNDGRDLSFVAPASIDAIWSFDVFVHLQAADVEGYVSQFAAILAPGGRAVIHHSRAGVQRRSWRSDMTAEAMRAIAERHGLCVMAQLETLKDGKFGVYQFGDAGSPDVVSILVAAA